MRRSDNITAGPERMPNRSLLRACGMTDEEMNQPIIGVVSAYSEIIPGHINLDKIADAVKAGVRMAGGTPVLVPAIGVCDGIAMGHIGMKYSLASRELIADSVETLAQAHQLDGLVLIPNCDKIVPGMLMAAARLNIPSILVSGGPMMAPGPTGRWKPLQAGGHMGPPLQEVVGWYKAMTTNQYIQSVKAGELPPFEKRLWQRGYYDHIIRDDNDFLACWTYIDQNPVRWAEDEYAPVSRAEE